MDTTVMATAGPAPRTRGDEPGGVPGTFTEKYRSPHPRG